jgi:flagellar basal body rod protein FlgG
MVGLSAQQVLRQRMDMTANNLANMTTAGFKAERLVMR